MGTGTFYNVQDDVPALEPEFGVVPPDARPLAFNFASAWIRLAFDAISSSFSTFG